MFFEGENCNPTFERILTIFLNVRGLYSVAGAPPSSVPARGGGRRTIAIQLGVGPGAAAAGRSAGPSGSGPLVRVRATRARGQSCHLPRSRSEPRYRRGTSALRTASESAGPGRAGPPGSAGPGQPPTRSPPSSPPRLVQVDPAASAAAGPPQPGPGVSASAAGPALRHPAPGPAVPLTSVPRGPGGGSDAADSDSD